MEQWNNENTEYTNQTITINKDGGMLEKEKTNIKAALTEDIVKKRKANAVTSLIITHAT